MATIYMQVLNEGTNVWRPVQATAVTSDTYRVEGNMPTYEDWAFAPNSLVHCRRTSFIDGRERMTVVGPAE
jgi:hypothetical protein